MIATKTSVDLSGIDEKVVEKASGEDYFAREKKDKKKGEEAFFKQGEKPEVSDSETSASELADTPKAKKVSSGRAEDQKAVDKALLGNIKKQDPTLLSYLAATFSLRTGDKPHEMVF